MKNMSTGVYMVEVKDASGNRIASGRVIKQ
ncbi:MAG: hypothetical protein JWQ27_2905, partial [Ferruginibacter sp.]|nr:hypothetical protein [Ferruginibacter sp.]